MAVKSGLWRRLMMRSKRMKKSLFVKEVKNEKGNHNNRACGAGNCAVSSPFAPARQNKLKSASPVPSMAFLIHIIYCRAKYSRATPISGFYIYDSATPDSDSSVYHGSYQHTTTPYGMSLAIGNLTFQTDPLNVDFVIGLTNNYYDEPWDYYTVTSYNNLQLNNGAIR